MKKSLYSLVFCLLATSSLFAQDSLALVALYNSTSGPNWTNTWDLSTPMRDWEGVTVNNSGRVIELDLSRNRLAGTIPPEIGQLSELEEINCSSNFLLTGSIPPELGQLSKLERIAFSFCRLSGSIPSELRQLSNLERISLGENNLTGILPAWLGELSNLEQISLYQNELEGIIPSEFRQLSKLRYISLATNNLTGVVPAWLGELRNLEQIDLVQNNLEGTIPTELRQLSNLTTLALGNNNLTGVIPVWLSELRNLRSLRLHGNELEGIIPTELSLLSRLENLSLSGNNLVGGIPTEFGQLRRLLSLSLSHNSLTGRIPIELGQLVELNFLSLDNNNLTGSIPDVLRQLRNLILLNLSDNQLSGSIPNSLAQLTTLESLQLGNNNLSSCIPDEFASLCYLTTTNLSRCGPAPTCQYDFTENPELPWQGDFERFCNGEEQIGASCNDGNSSTQNDRIRADCSCRGTSTSTTYLIDNHDGQTIETCEGTFADSGGLNSGYMPNEDYSVTFCPDTPDKRIRLFLLELEIGSTTSIDGLCFYDGTTIDAPLITCLSGDFSVGEVREVSASNENESGCLSIRFTSGFVTNAGWRANIICLDKCPNFEAQILPSLPLSEEGFLDICIGQELQFSNTTNAPSSFETEYNWNFGDGSSASGQESTHTYTEAGGYNLSLRVSNPNTLCSNVNDNRIKVRVAPPPTIQLPQLDDAIYCTGSPIELNSEIIRITEESANDRFLLVSSDTASFIPDVFRAESLALPDGEGNSYTSRLFLDAFEEGATMQNSSDIEGICLNIEHSWARDLKISLTCPSGKEVILHNFWGQTGQRIRLGEPNEGDNTFPIPGIGADYCWKSNTENGTWIEYTEENSPNSISSLPGGDYAPYQNIDEFIGCPLNGEWQLEVEDLWAIDNGYIFNWGILFDPDLLVNVGSFSPSILSFEWQEHPDALFLNADSIALLTTTAGILDVPFIVTDEFGCTYESSVSLTVQDTGASCDDGNPNTSNDIITEDCECLGVLGCPPIARPQSNGNVSICSNEEIPPLSVRAGGVNNESEIRWYTVATGGNPIATGFSFTATQTRTYFAEIYNTTTDCASPRTEIRLEILTIGSACNDGNPSTSNDTITENCECLGTIECPSIARPQSNGNVSICSGEEIAPLSVGAAGVGNGSEIRWYTVATGGNPIATGFSFTSTQAGIYFAEIYNTTTDCASPRTEIRLSINETNNASITGSTQVCEGETTRLIASTGSRYIWSNASTSNTITVDQGSYTVTVIDANNCEATASVNVRETASPSLVIASSPECDDDLETYSVRVNIDTNNTLTTTNGTITGGGGFFTIRDIIVGVNIVVTVRNPEGCETTQAIAAPDCSCPPVAAPQAINSNLEYCSNEDFTLRISSAGVNNESEVRWYNGAIGGSPIATGFSFTAPQAGTYFAEIYNTLTGCQSPRTAIRLEIIAVGSPCDDGNPNTSNDAITEDCECLGIEAAIENDLTFYVDSEAVTTRNGAYIVPIGVLNFTDVRGFQFTLALEENFNNAILNLTSTAALDSINHYLIPENNTELAILWDDLGAQGVSLADSTQIFEVHLEINEAPLECVPLQFIDIPTEIIAVIADANISEFRPITIDGEICVTENIQLAGRIYTEERQALKNVTVNCIEEETRTDAQGVYAFNEISLGTSCFITPQHDTLPRNGVTVSDIVLIRDVILGALDLDSPYKRIAADANNNKTININDIIQIRRVILTQLANFDQNTSWNFVPQSYPIQLPETRTAVPVYEDEILLEESTNDSNNLDFIGIKTGDVNATANTQLQTDGVLQLFMNDSYTLDEETVKVSILARDLATIEGYQMELVFNPKVLELVDVVFDGLKDLDKDCFGFTHLEQGIISTLWYKQKAVDSEVLFSLEFKAKQATKLSEVLQIRAVHLPALAVTNTMKELAIVGNYIDKKAASTQTNQEEFTDFRVLKEQPNPFKEETTIVFQQTTSDWVELVLYDIAGRIVYQERVYYSSGVHQWKLDARKLGAGIYFYRMQNTTQNVVNKLILQE